MVLRDVPDDEHSLRGVREALERELGVTYKTAWRMANLIRNELMTRTTTPRCPARLRPTRLLRRQAARDKAKARARRQGERPEAPLYRCGPRLRVRRYRARRRVRAMVVPDSQPKRSGARCASSSCPSSATSPTSWAAYTASGREYASTTASHTQGVYVSGDVHTKTIEGFWSTVKRGIRGNYHSVSAKWLQGYLNEFVWRYNRRGDTTPMLHTVLRRSASVT